MGYGERIRQARLRFGLTQRELGERLGATDSYISHLENELRVPSWDFAVALTRICRFPAKEQQEFLDSIDRARLERARNRGRRGRQSRLSGGADVLEGSPANRESLDADRIATELQSYPDLAAAYRDLVTAFSQPEYREAVIKTLRALAESAAAETRTRPTRQSADRA